MLDDGPDGPDAAGDLSGSGRHGAADETKSSMDDLKDCSELNDSRERADGGVGVTEALGDKCVLAGGGSGRTEEGGPDFGRRGRGELGRGGRRGGRGKEGGEEDVGDEKAKDGEPGEEGRGVVGKQVVRDGLGRS